MHYFELYKEPSKQLLPISCNSEAKVRSHTSVWIWTNDNSFVNIAKIKVCHTLLCCYGSKTLRNHDKCLPVHKALIIVQRDSSEAGICKEEYSLKSFERGLVWKHVSIKLDIFIWGMETSQADYDHTHTHTHTHTHIHIYINYIVWVSFQKAVSCRCWFSVTFSSCMI